MEREPENKGLNASPQWYIWYTKPRAEKKVNDLLLKKGIDVYLPLRKELRQWSDRKKWVEVPLFNGYIFTRVTLREFEMIAYTPGILTYLRTEGKPATLRENQINEIRMLLKFPDQVRVEEVLHPGEPVEIVLGPLTGLSGEMVNYRGGKKLAIRIEQLGKVILVQLPNGYVKSRIRA